MGTILEVKPTLGCFQIAFEAWGDEFIISTDHHGNTLRIHVVELVYFTCKIIVVWAVAYAATRSVLLSTVICSNVFCVVLQYLFDGAFKQANTIYTTTDSQIWDAVLFLGRIRVSTHAGVSMDSSTKYMLESGSPHKCVEE